MNLHMKLLGRRTLLRAAAAGPFAGFLSRTAIARVSLAPVADGRDGAERLRLPDGFSYRSFHDTTAEVILDDGTRLPGRHDGMGAFDSPGGDILLVRNHEIKGTGTAFGPVTPYDPKAPGGTTTVRVTRFGEVLESYASLSGTLVNCNGGRMPWGSWISCEETINGPDVGPDPSGRSNIPLRRPHGFIFEVPAGGTSGAQPITSAGRFVHEAVAYDPEGRALYLTEDNYGHPSGFYRYLPPDDPMSTGRLSDGGRLEMLAIKGVRHADLARAQKASATFECEWVPIDDPAPAFPYTRGQEAETANDTAVTWVGRQGRALGAAGFSRLEGCVFSEGTVYFTSTRGGGAAVEGPFPVPNGYGRGNGQIWAYDTRSATLRLVFQSPRRSVLDLPDSVAVGPGGMLVLCEDNDRKNRLRGLTPQGKLVGIARNREDAEFAGAVFSPDGHTLFVNVQAEQGLTFAIWGPWHALG